MNKRLRRFYNFHRDETVILVANGPSLNQIDLKLLQGYPIIGLNKIFLGFKKFGFYPTYHVVVNDIVIEQSKHNIINLNCVKFVSLRNAHMIPENALTYHIDTYNPPARFCVDIVDGVNEGGTVTYVALQLAYYMGFRTVIIIGLDHDFSYMGRPNETHILEGPDNNHFIDNYFGYGQKWDNPDLEKSEVSYALARAVYEADNRRILDATIGGKCSIFKKVDYYEYFNKNK